MQLNTPEHWGIIVSVILALIGFAAWLSRFLSAMNKPDNPAKSPTKK
ncbi:MAG: hypothetical protein V1668_02885 [Patescibacteria group bacterium]